MIPFVLDCLAGVLILRHLWYALSFVWMRQDLTSDDPEECEEAFKTILEAAGKEDNVFNRRVLYDSIVGGRIGAADVPTIWVPALIGAFWLILHYAHLFR